MSFGVTIIRHGETDFNLKQLVHSSSNGTINDTGRQQADKLGKYLKDEKYTRVYSSDLQRCQDTAQGVLSNLTHPVPPIKLDRRLREREFGEWDGRPMMDLFKMAKEQNIPLRDVTAPDGETTDEAAKRVINFFKDLFTLRDTVETDENILIFSHGITIQCFLRYVTSNPDTYEVHDCPFEPMSFAGNTGRTQFTIEKFVENQPRKIKFTCLHDHSHL